VSNNILDKLKKLELEGIIDILKYQKTTSWINIKNYLYSKSLQGVVKSAGSSIKDYLSKHGIYLLLISILNYFRYIFSNREKIVFVGAGSGLLEIDNKTLDEYLPEELDKEDIIYLLSAEYPKKLIKHQKYIKQNHIIIYSFLIAPLVLIFSKFKKNTHIECDNIISYLKENDFNITKDELEYIHKNFIVKYTLYNLFLKPLKIKKAFVVSAYSNTELISVLTKRGVEIIEIQHGLIGSMHRGYNYATKDKLLPTPNKIYVYNEFWKQELINAAYYRNEQIEIKGRLKYKLIDKNLQMYNNKFIVFTGQGGFYEEIRELFNHSLAFLQKEKIKLIYLPHPNETIKDITNLKSNIIVSEFLKILEHKQYITEQYIYSSIAHISVYSSCHFDAIHYKNKTFVFDIMRDNPMNYYVKNFKDKFMTINSISERLLDD